MTLPALLEHLWIIGPGRLGLALGSELLAAQAVGRITFSGRGVPPRHPVFEDPRVHFALFSEHVALPPADLAILAVPDGAIPSVAAALAHRAPATLPLLHTSGALGSSILRVDGAAVRPVGTLHPLVAVADPVRGAAALRGAWFGVEGDEAAAALATRLVQSLQGRPLRVATEGKPLYHAAAVFASNYVVALLAVAERLMGEAGVAPEEARAALASLAAGAVANVAVEGPVAALTGPVARGDEGTLALHLARLSHTDRPLYSDLARQALELARRRGLPDERVAALAELLHGAAP